MKIKEVSFDWGEPLKSEAERFKEGACPHSAVGGAVKIDREDGYPGIFRETHYPVGKEK